MSNDGNEIDRRILIVDDNVSIHADFRKILAPGPAAAAIDEDEADLFGKPDSPMAVESYEIDSAFQGKEALRMVQKAVRDDRPYALAFVDVRMPPGWDAIETIAHLWPVDPHLQIVICTAYSDYSWDEMIEKLGMSDRLLILKKPFDNVEVCQLAAALTEKRRVAKLARLKMYELERMVENRTRELAESEARSRAIVNGAADGIITCRDDGLIESFNPAAEAIFGYARAEIVGCQIEVLAAPGHGASLTAELAGDGRTDDQVSADSRRELEGQRQDKSIFPMELAATEVRVGERSLFTLLIQDITERKTAQELDHRRQVELAQAVRLGTMSEMIARLAEDIDHPLTAIANFAQGSAYLIRSGADNGDALLGAMNDILAQAERASAILERVREVSQRRDPRIDAFDLNEVIRGLAESVQPDARSCAMSVKLELEERIPQLHADTKGIEQVLLNLIRNALEASDSAATDGNELLIQTSLAGSDAVVIAVHDKGLGIPAEDLPRMFDPFFTTKPDGLGMGLAISRSIVDAHGGRLWATPRSERGMTVRFTLPIGRPGQTDSIPDRVDVCNQEQAVV